ncbi:MAG TPA: recombinase family protein [Candidatus Anaerofilum faecale]|nr:recombinase family protein [Candidatus Anaerofilum faecale]
MRNEKCFGKGSGRYLPAPVPEAAGKPQRDSQNVTMGIRRGFKEGKCQFHYKNFIGYRRGADGNPEVDPEGAKIILRIFLSYLCGDTPEQIAQALERDGILSPTGRTSWSKTTVRNILQNEKYAGDVLLQKTYTVDFLEKKMRKNRGEVAQYYVTDHHPAIVTREIFQQVQLEIARRSSKAKVSCRKTKTNRGKYTSKFALSERLVCGECGAMYRRTMWKKRDGTKEYVWRCINRLEQGTRCCKNSPSLKSRSCTRRSCAASAAYLIIRKRLCRRCRESSGNCCYSQESRLARQGFSSGLMKLKPQ